MVKEKKKITPIDYVKENFFTDTLWLSGLKSAHFFYKINFIKYIRIILGHSAIEVREFPLSGLYLKKRFRNNNENLSLTLAVASLSNLMFYKEEKKPQVHLAGDHMKEFSNAELS